MSKKSLFIFMGNVANKKIHLLRKNNLFWYGIVLGGIFLLGCSTPSIQISKIWQKHALSLPLLQYPKKQDCCTVNLSLAYSPRYVGLAHLWEHLILRELRKQYPQYLFAGQTRPNSIVLECTCPANQDSQAFAILTSVFFVPFTMKSIQNELRLMEWEKKQYSHTNIWQANDLEGVQNSLFSFQRKLLQMSLPSIIVQSKSSIIQRSSVSHPQFHRTSLRLCLSDDEFARWGEVCAVFFAQNLYQDWVYTGKCYSTEVSRSGNSIIISILSAIEVEHSIFQNWLEGIKNQEILSVSWELLVQRTWLYCRQSNRPIPSQDISQEEFKVLLQRL